MEIESNNKRYYTIIAVILVFTVISIFMISLSGVENKGVYTEPNIGTLGIDFQTKINSGSKEIVPVAQRGKVDYLDTEQGYIKVLDAYIDYPLPLHLSKEELEDWYALIEVRGGYEPLCGWIDVWQEKVGYAGRINMEWEYLGLEPSWFEYWQVSFVPEGDIFLHSNQYPKVDNDWFFIDKQGEIPDKHVMFDVYTLWTGCDNEDQNFEIILVQKFSLQNYKLPI
ncbi:MAG: hypothetical protein ACFFG0_32770 [Candidatus Thorarchaeota archaeon]